MNRHFGKLINGQLSYAPSTIIISGVPTQTNRSDLYLRAGYKAVALTNIPSRDGYYYTESWVEDETTITQTWVEHTNYHDIESEATLEDRIADLEVALCDLADVIFNL